MLNLSDDNPCEESDTCEFSELCPFYTECRMIENEDNKVRSAN